MKIEMKSLTLKEIQKIEFEILKEFAQFCAKHNLKYYLAGGTLLGAIRHKGFIPWDDDIDVCMPRKDYMYFINNFDEWNRKLKVKCNYKSNIDAPFAKIVNLDTIIYSKYANNNIDTNICIDIFPVDGLPENLNEVIY